MKVCVWKIALLCSNVRSIAWDGLYTSLSKKESRGMARTCIILLINLRLFPSSVVLHTTSIHRGRGLIDRSGEESDISVGMGKMCPPPLPLIDGANESWDTREGGKGNKKEGKRRWGGCYDSRLVALVLQKTLSHTFVYRRAFSIPSHFPYTSTPTTMERRKV